MCPDKIQQFTTFFLRHLFASIISIVAAILVVVIAYFTLLIVAIVTNSGLGGPLSLPFFIAAAGVLSLFYTACLIFPSVALAELISQRIHSHKYLAQALLSTLMLAILIFILAIGFRTIDNFESPTLLELANYPVQIFLVLCLPLGFYWLATKTVQVAMIVIIKLFDKVSHTYKAY